MKRSAGNAEVVLDGQREGARRKLRTKLGEIAINLAVITVLGVAAQQSVAGFRVVHGRQLAVFTPHQQAARFSNEDDPGARVMPAAEIVFGPDGSLLRATSITITDDLGNSKTIAFGPTGEPYLQ